MADLWNVRSTGHLELSREGIVSDAQVNLGRSVFGCQDSLLPAEHDLTGMQALRRSGVRSCHAPNEDEDLSSREQNNGIHIWSGGKRQGAVEGGASVRRQFASERRREHPIGPPDDLVCAVTRCTPRDNYAIMDFGIDPKRFAISGNKAFV